MNLEDKAVLVTGGGTGIGAACAEILAKENCRVAVLGRRQEKLEQFSKTVDSKHPVKFRTCDVSDRENVRESFGWFCEEFGRIDILINNAGVNIPNRAFDSVTPEDWDRLLQINATGTYNCIYFALPQMKKQKDGLIVNISSIAGIRALLLGGAAYNASKFAMAALGITVGQEVKDEGIRVTNIYPGEVDTPILENRPTPVSAEHRAQILQAEDIAAAVLMVAKLPPRANVWEMTIKPTTQAFV